MTKVTIRDCEQRSSLRKVMSVKAPEEVAWRVFTEKMGAWWPLAVRPCMIFKMGKASAAEVLFEPRASGRWYDRVDSGSTFDWGRVLSWEPYARLILSWEIDADWQHNPNPKTEARCASSPRARKARVELEHRHLDRYGARRDEARGIFDSPVGWRGVLVSFARAAESQTGGTAMSDITPTRKALVARILQGHGRGSHALRRAAFDSGELAQPLSALIRNFARHAYQVTDEDIAVARASDFSEDEIFELVVCAAIGQATRQYDTALAAVAEAMTDKE
jgi:hypothetical protein